MKRIVAQLYDAQRPDYDPEEHGEVIKAGEHHGGDLKMYMAHKFTKLREMQVPASADIRSNIFKDCIMFVNGLTDPPVDELRRLIRTNGGECIAYRAVKITHYVCDYFTDAQLKQEYLKIKLNAKNKVHNVMVTWVTDSIKAGKRQDENSYAPRGQEQHGKNLSNSFFKSTPTSSSLSSASSISYHMSAAGEEELKSVKLDAQVLLSATGSSTTVDLTNDCFTLSQDQFLAALPIDLREEASRQILRQTASTKDASPSGQIAVSSRASSITQSQPTNCAVYDSIADENTVNKDDARESPSVQRLRDLIDCVHYDPDGAPLTSKAVTLRLREYLRQLLQQSRGAGCAAAADVRRLQQQVQGLLCDYISWLARAQLFDQVTFKC